jgi:hypothetical protein
MNAPISVELYGGLVLAGSLLWALLSAPRVATRVRRYLGLLATPTSMKSKAGTVVAAVVGCALHYYYVTQVQGALKHSPMPFDSVVLYFTVLAGGVHLFTSSLFALYRLSGPTYVVTTVASTLLLFGPLQGRIQLFQHAVLLVLILILSIFTQRNDLRDSHS